MHNGYNAYDIHTGLVQLSLRDTLVTKNTMTIHDNLFCRFTVKETFSAHSMQVERMPISIGRCQQDVEECIFYVYSLPFCQIGGIAEQKTASCILPLASDNCKRTFNTEPWNLAKSGSWRQVSEGPNKGQPELVGLSRVVF